jgi:peptidoglycan/LPS O-acetylase OafA/YrhL
VLTVITLLVDRAEGTLVGGLFLLSTALPFLVVYLLNRKRWWALIPAWVLFVLSMITIFSEIVDGNLIGAFFLYSVALPFLVVYLMDRKRRWALIPAAILAILGTIPLFASLIGGDAMGAAVMLLFAVPFLIAYLRSKENWWALIPAGVFITIGVVVVLGMVLPEGPLFQGIMTGTLFLGFGLTFGLLWLRRKSTPTAWARYPMIGLLAAALLAYFLGDYFQSYWAVVLLIVGILMVITGLRPKKQDTVKPIEDKPAEK